MIDLSTTSQMGDSPISTKVDRAAYLTQLLEVRSPINDQLHWLEDIRNQASARIPELAIPSSRDEEWRFTNLNPILNTRWQTIDTSTPITRSDIESFLLSDVSVRLVFVDGRYRPELSAIDRLPGDIFVGDLIAAQEAGLQDQILTHLAHQPGAEETFTTLNAASFTNGAIIVIPRNQVLDIPIHVLFVSAKNEFTSLNHPRCVVLLESNSSAVLVEDYVAIDESVYFTNSVTEIWLAANAQISHTRVQREAKTAIHIGKTAISQARDSQYFGNAISLGAVLSRHNLEIYQTGEQTYTALDGLTMIRGEQVADTHSLISFTKPHSTSNQIHKCIVDDRAHAVFNGKILVPQAAQLTDARQLSKNLLLSEKARVDTKPQLEITADNVKCAHGATVSQLENDEIFYLQSRGIDQTQAMKLLTYAFAYEVIEKIPIASLRDNLLQHIT